MLLDERIDKVTIEINNIREYVLKSVNIEMLNQNRIYLISKNIRLSMAHIIYKNLLTIDSYVKQLYQNTNDKVGNYIEFEQYKWDLLFVICVRANFLGIDPYPTINRNNNLDYLTEHQKAELLQVNEKAINRYFDFFMEYNIEAIKGFDSFINKMSIFGENHNLSEEEINDFIHMALERNINVAYIDSQEELDKVFDSLYPKA